MYHSIVSGRLLEPCHVNEEPTGLHLLLCLEIKGRMGVHMVRYHHVKLVAFMHMVSQVKVQSM